MTLVMAHRGASKAAAENTVAAFRAALALGADMVELDVRLTADGALAVVHDPVLADGRAIRGTLAADLPDHIPMLDAALDACTGMTVNVEIKNSPREPGFDPSSRAADAVAARLARRDGGSGVVVSSFHLATLDRMRALAPSVETAYLVNVVSNQGRLVELLVERGHGGVHPWHALVTRRLVERCHAAGLAVRPWTVDEPDRIVKLARAGVDAVCTNVPDVARAALRAAPA